MIKSEIIKEILSTAVMGQNMICYDEVDSTNTVLRKLAGEGAVSGTLVTAETQTSGRGRRGRTWLSLKGSSILMSLLIRPDFEPEKARMLTIIMALSVAQAVEKSTELKAFIKWPNDIVVNNKKVTGILTEMILNKTTGPYVIIGTGINVNAEDFPDEIKDIATSLKKESGKIESREEIIAYTMNCFEENYNKFLKAGNLSLIKKEYESFLVNKDKEVMVLGEKEPYKGTALGIDNEGELLVKDTEGKVNKIYAGEVSVRGLYGYV